MAAPESAGDFAVRCAEVRDAWRRPLTDRDIETSEESAEAKQSARVLPGAERLFVRMTLWQTILSVVGIFIAVVALYAALKESAAVRQQTAAAVWPFVQLIIEDYDTGETAGFALSFMNAGVGPAKIAGVRLEFNGEPVRDWVQAVTVVGGDTNSDVSRNFVSGRVLRPEETVDMIRTTEAELARRFQAAIAKPGKHITYCYCSIFDECWLADSRRDLQDPEPVAMCPDFGEDAFQN
jgi:hypothetical protein